MRRRLSIYKSYYRREEENTTGRGGLLVGRWLFLCELNASFKRPEGDRLLSGVLHQPMNSRLNRRI